jgi:hypothetical protein
MEEEPKPNLDQVIDNIQIEHIVFIEHVVSIAELTQLVVKVIESSNLFNL